MVCKICSSSLERFWQQYIKHDNELINDFACLVGYLTKQT